MPCPSNRSMYPHQSGEQARDRPARQHLLLRPARLRAGRKVRPCAFHILTLIMAAFPTPLSLLTRASQHSTYLQEPAGVHRAGLAGQGQEALVLHLRAAHGRPPPGASVLVTEVTVTAAGTELTCQHVYIFLYTVRHLRGGGGGGVRDGRHQAPREDAGQEGERPHAADLHPGMLIG